MVVAHWGQRQWWWRPQRILISMSSPRGPYFSTKTWLHSIAYSLKSWNASGQTSSKTETQPHPKADRLPEGILSSQLPQNTPLDAALPIKGTRPSSIHQMAGTSLSHEDCTSPWTNLTQQGAGTRSKRNYDPEAYGKETTNTES